MNKEVVILNEERNVSLTVYLLEESEAISAIRKRPLVLVLPGGSYQFCSDREADPVAFPYLKAGYHAAIRSMPVGPIRWRTMSSPWSS